MSDLKRFDPRPLWQRGKWTFAMLSLLSLLALGLANRLTGGSPETDRDLALALGALISVYLGGESWQDGRVKSALAARNATRASAVEGDEG